MAGRESNSSTGRAYKVSYNRPFATRDYIGTDAGPQDFVFGAEISAIRWLEDNGYDVCLYGRGRRRSLDRPAKAAN